SAVSSHCNNTIGRGGGLRAAFKPPAVAAAIDSGGLGFSSTPKLPQEAGFAGLLAHMARLGKRSQLKDNQPTSTSPGTTCGGKGSGGIGNNGNLDAAASFSSGAAAAAVSLPPPAVTDSDSEDVATGTGGAFGSSGGQPQIFWRQPQLPLQTLLTLRHLPHTGAAAENSPDRAAAQRPSPPLASLPIIFSPRHAGDLEGDTMMLVDNENEYTDGYGDGYDDVERHWDSQGSHFVPGGGAPACAADDATTAAAAVAAAAKAGFVTTEGEIEMAPILERISFGRMLHRMVLQPSAAAAETATSGDASR
ncbi:hypothetical protein Vretifemale_18117, partial [Volvox reticuliferus]